MGVVGGLAAVGRRETVTGDSFVVEKPLEKVFLVAGRHSCQTRHPLAFSTPRLALTASVPFGTRVRGDESGNDGVVGDNVKIKKP